MLQSQGDPSVSFRAGHSRDRQTARGSVARFAHQLAFIEGWNYFLMRLIFKGQHNTADFKPLIKDLRSSALQSSCGVKVLWPRASSSLNLVLDS